MIEYIWNKIIKKMRGRAVRNSTVSKLSKIESGSIFLNSSMNKYSFCGYNCKIINTDIGAYCSIADNVVIGGAEHPINWVSTSPVFYAGKDSVKQKFSTFERKRNNKTIIENDVWIGENVLIKGGVKIGTGAIIGMGAVVCHDVEPYEIVGGVPARHIKFRFDRNIIEKLLSSQWWLLDDDVLIEKAKFIQNPEKFIEEILK